jgi:hypothetical protein
MWRLGKMTSLKRRVTAKDVRLSLKLLNGSVSNIVKNLKKRRIKGRKNRVDSCPIACYLAKKFKPAYIEVTPSNVFMEFYKNENDSHTVDCKLSKPFRDFIKKFDNGQFPELEL